MSTQVEARQPGDPEPEVYVALPMSVALRLRATLPGLMRALEDRETQTERQRARRREAYVLLELMRDGLNDALPPIGAATEINVA
jgi:hypothetical protein